MRVGNHFLIAGLLILFIGMTSCSKSSLPDEIEETKGLLLVHPQWGNYVMSKTFYTHLYQPKAGPLNMETAPSEYSITTETGNYSIISHNTNVSGVNFTDMDNYQQAKVTAMRIDQTKAGSKELHPSGKAYRLAVELVTIKAGEEIHIYPSIYSLTKTLILQFEVKNGEQYKRISGTLEGVYYAVYLATGLPVGQDTDWKIPFDIEINEDNTATATIYLLGIYDPENGVKYHNTLDVILKDDEGETYPTEIDLSEVITDILDENEGEIPIDIPVEIDVVLERISDGSIVATVKPWEEGKGGGEI